MNEVAEKPSKEFLEYCKGKLFLIDGCDLGKPFDRWVVFGEDATKILNYHTSAVQAHGKATANINFSSSVYDSSPVDIEAVIVMSSRIPYQEVEFLLDEVETIQYNSASILHCVFNHVKAAIGEI